MSRSAKPPSPHDLEAALAHWPGEGNLECLRAEWQRQYRAAPPSRLSADLLQRGITYKIQERALGSLRPAALRKLNAAIKALDEGAAPANTSRAASTRIKPGSALIRTWRGVTHRVHVLEEGFEYQGEIFASLSTIASQITGAHWSGPRFFGLKRRKSAPSTDNADA